MGQTLLDVTTDKVDVEVPAPAAGVITRIVAGAGETIEVGALLAELGPPNGGNGSGNGAAASGGRPRGDAPRSAPRRARRGAGDGRPDRAPRHGVGHRGRRGRVARRGRRRRRRRPDRARGLDRQGQPRGARARGGHAWPPSPSPSGETFTVGQPLGEIATGATAGAAAPSAPAPSAPRRGGPRGRRRPRGRRQGRRRHLAAASPPSPGAPPWRRASTPSTLVGQRPRRASSARPTWSPPPRRPPRRPRHAAPLGRGRGGGRPLRGPAAALAGYMDDSLIDPDGHQLPHAQRRRPRRPAPPINADLKAAGRSEKLSFTHLIAWAIVRRSPRSR